MLDELKAIRSQLDALIEKYSTTKKPERCARGGDVELMNTLVNLEPRLPFEKLANVYHNRDFVIEN